MSTTHTVVPKRPSPPAGLTCWDHELACPGYTLYCPMRGEPMAYLLDMHGKPVHSWHLRQKSNCVELLPNGNLLYLGNVPGEWVPSHLQEFLIRELTWDGEPVWEFRGFALVKGGIADSGSEKKMMGDLFAEVTPEGEVVWEWHSHEHLNLDEDVICPLCTRKEWTHANSCDVTPAGDILTTFRLTNTAAVIDKNSGDFKWKWGRGELGHPHDPTLLENGNVLIFDNGMHIPRLPRSRLVEVDPRTDEIIWSYESERYLDFLSPHISSAQRLWNGNTLACEGDRGRFFEVTPDKEVVLEFYNPDYVSDDIVGRTVHNWVFRVRRYPPDFPAFGGRKLPQAIRNG